MNTTEIRESELPPATDCVNLGPERSLSLRFFTVGSTEDESVFNPTGPYSIDAFSTKYMRITRIPRGPNDWDPATGTLTLSNPSVFQCRNVLFSPEGVLYDRTLCPIPEALNTYGDIDNYLGMHTDISPARMASWHKPSSPMKWLSRVRHRIRRRTPQIPPLIRFRDPILLYFDHYYYNFTHFLVEAYPRLFAFRKQLIDYIPLLPRPIPGESRPGHSCIVACLQSLGISATSCLAMHDHAYYSLEDLTFPSHVKMHPWYVVPAIDHLRDFFSDHHRSLGHERIYISREQAPGRKLQNGAEVDEVLAEHGFRKVVMESLTFREKVNVMRHGRVLVCSDGSSVTNAVFMPRGAKILAFRPPVFPNYNVVLSAVFGHSFYCQVCPFATQDQCWGTGDLLVDIPALKKSLHQLI